jgi:hypothetical protein
MLLESKYGLIAFKAIFADSGSKELKMAFSISFFND